MLTIQDVAQRAKVSPSTASKVINRRNDVSPSAITAVQAAVAELKYVHGPRGRRRLAAGQKGRRRTNHIALLAAGLSRSHLNAPVYMDVLHGVEAAVRESGKSLLLTHLPPEAGCPAQLFPHKTDGIILFGRIDDERLILRLPAVACVQIMGAIARDGQWDHVSYDNGKLGQIAAAYLLARGHRHAAFVTSETRSLFVERGKVFCAALQAAGGGAIEVVDEESAYDGGPVQQVKPKRMQAVVDRIMAAAPRPTAVFLAADVIAPSLYLELYRRGLTPGEDLAVISCNYEGLLLAGLHPRPATIDIHAERVGRKAVEQLLWRIEHPRDPRITIALEPTLVEGE